jgi:hypothetical protein
MSGDEMSGDEPLQKVVRSRFACDRRRQLPGQKQLSVLFGRERESTRAAQ